MTRKLQWGILGTGMIAKRLATAIAESKTGELLAVGSRQLATAKTFGKEFKVPRCYGSYAELLADPDVQVVYNSLPNHLHCEWTVRTAEAGKHSLCEKPLATNYAEAMTLVEACRYHDVFLMEAFMYRCHPQTAKLVELIKSGAIGEVRLIQAHFAYNMGQKLENIRLQNEAAGGGIMDVGCYCASMARLVAGAALGLEGPAEPREVKGVAHLGKASRVDEWATAVLKFDGDILANLSAGNNVGVDSTLRIWGSAGNIQVPNPWFPGTDKASARILLQADGKKPKAITAPSKVPLYAHEVDTVAKHLAAKQAPTPCMTWQDSLGNMQTLDQWRGQVGLAFDREQEAALTVPFSARPLRRRPDHVMRYGRIEGLDKPVARVVMGSMVFHTHRLPYTCALLDHYVECGGNAIDLAFVYSGGHSEPAVGKWLKLRNNRKDIVLAGKGAATTEATPEIVNRELLITLDRLQTDLDIYMMHRDNVNVPVGEFVDCLNEHVRAGRMRLFGGSNWTCERLDAANAYARKKGLQGFSVSSPNFALAQWNEPMWAACVMASDPASRAWYARTQMPLFSWSSQASGLFTGRYSPKDHSNREVVRVWYNTDNFKRLKRAQQLARKKKVTALQIALAYVLDQPGLNIYALIGPASLEEIRTSLAALTVELTPAELRWLNLEG